jgi:hypothetical protein
LRLGARELGEMAVKLGYPVDGFGEVLEGLLMQGTEAG